MGGKNPKFMLIYKCHSCGMESGFTELDVAHCRFCEGETILTLVSKKEITIELMQERLRSLADNIMKNLTSAYEAMPEELKQKATKDFDPEKELLLAMEKAKEYRNKIYKLKFKNPKKKKKK